ncbi:MULTISPECIES: PQQ-dependent sugar dehydrogenase [unclassified Shewanella]|uniref:PQQ-dependent sugar dehydrogenase n=1 Tax=unclassified Shewanella TaxID=196818 RepID=UPI001BC82197|nr:MULTISPECIES: PQQ-dependent sugar dehydrogenase [unclassified Shewanella]GIU04943.1 dehydrogenase [Shewanella sp. MBTL60-112-B1]GIU24602.1 dehydrogenase [Shewanella sp. MBTL60-112-B2]
MLMKAVISKVGLILLAAVSSHSHAYEAEKITTGLNIPWGLAYVDEQSMLVTERQGVVKRVNLETGKHQTLFTPEGVWTEGQGGLLDVALSPFDTDFKSKKVYFTYSKDIEGEGATTLAQATYQNGRLTDWQDLFVSASRTDTGRHFGSRIAFDDNSLYFSIGDRGVRENGQDTLTHAGSILRLQPDGSVPADNPFINNSAILDEIWSYGHRNPQGLVYDSNSQQLWSIEHGPRGGDEINLIKRGANYGWPITSHGKEYWGPISVGDGKVKEGVEPPVKVYIPSIAPGSLVMYRGEKFPELNGKLLAGALKLTHINVVTINDAGKAIAEERIMAELGERIRDIEVTPKGDIYFSTDSGNLYRLKR